MSVVVRRWIPLGLAIISALFMLGDQYLTIPAIHTIATELQFNSTMFVTFVITVGAIGLIIRSVRQISERKAGMWYFNGLALFMFGLFFLVGLVYTQPSENYQLIFKSIIDPINATTFASAGLYIIYAVYRNYRFRSYEGAVLILVSILTIFTTMPIGEYLIPISVPIATYINDVVLTGTGRAFTIVAAIGAIMLSIRMLLGVEKGFLGE